MASYRVLSVPAKTDIYQMAFPLFTISQIIPSTGVDHSVFVVSEEDHIHVKRPHFWCMLYVDAGR